MKETHEDQNIKSKIKNILNCLLHFFLFKSMTAQLLIDLIFKLMNSFTETDIEILIFILHNIGLQLRKEDPTKIMQIIDMAQSKKNSYAVELKLKNMEADGKSKKINFLTMELQDIKNNKGNVTLQVRSIEHLQTWLKRDSQLSSELNVKPIDVTEKLINSNAKWWHEDKQTNTLNPSNSKDYGVTPESADFYVELAKQQKMTTDVKKAVFQAIVSSEDFLQAFENCERLNLKKEQQREVIKVLMHCCLQEKKLYNPFYGLLAQRLIKENPQSYKYSYKYTLWDYLKSIENLDIKQLNNLAKLTGHLLLSMSIPLHFLKVVDFEDDDAVEGKTGLFLHLVFDYLIKESSVEHKDKLKQVIETGLNDKDLGSFGKGLSQFLLSTFYVRIKKQNGGTLSPETKTKLKVVFDAIKEKTESIFVES